MDKKEHEFEKSSIILFVMMMTGNVCNYIYQIVMGHMLSTADYGTLNTLISLIMLLTVPMGVFQMMAGKYVAHYNARGETQRMAGVVQQLFRISFFVAVVVLIAGVALAKPVALVLKIESTGFIAAAMLVVALSLLSPALAGALQGNKQFVALGFTNVLLAVVKFIGSVAFVWLGFGIYGNLFAVALATAGVVAFEFYVLRACFSARGPQGSKLDVAPLKQYFHTAFWVQVITAVLSNGDILLVKAFVADPADAGIYSSGMVLGKMSIYAVNAVVTALFPMVAEQQAGGEDTRPLLKKAIFYGGGLSLLCAAGMCSLGNFVIGLLFGSRYMAAVPLLFPINCFVVPLTLITILMNYLAARAETRGLTVSLALGVVAIVGLVMFFHKDVAQLLYIMGGVLLVVFAGNLLFALKKPERKQQNR